MIYLYISKEKVEMIDPQEMIESSAVDVLTALLEEHKRLAQEYLDKSTHHNNKAKELTKALEALRKEGDAIESDRTKVSRAPILEYITKHPQGVKNTDIVEALFPNLTPAEKQSVIRNMAVVLYMLERDKKITKHKITGQKGNTYKPVFNGL